MTFVDTVLDANRVNHDSPTALSAICLHDACTKENSCVEDRILNFEYGCTPEDAAL